MAGKALEGIRVLEYCRTISGPYCSKLMADLGAEVIHIESPRTGDETRRLPPFVGEVPDTEKSALFLFLNTNKLGITLDPRLPSGTQIFRRLAAGADVLVEDWPAGHMEELGCGYSDLRPLNTGLIMASITPFGRSGPYKAYKAYGLNISHASGQGYMLPLHLRDLERAPVKVGGNCTDYDSGQTTGIAILAALYWKGITGKGQFIEVSQQEAVLGLQRIENVVFANSGEVLTRKGPRGDQDIEQMFRTQDGYVIAVTPLAHQQQALAKLVGAQVDSTTGALDRETLRDRLVTWLRERTSADACARAQALSIPMSPISSPEDVARSEQMKSRDFFADVEHPIAGTVKLPARFCQFSRTPVALDHAAPLLGQHNEVIYRDRLGLAPDELRALQDAGVI